MVAFRFLSSRVSAWISRQRLHWCNGSSAVEAVQSALPHVDDRAGRKQVDTSGGGAVIESRVSSWLPVELLFTEGSRFQQVERWTEAWQGHRDRWSDLPL